MKIHKVFTILIVVVLAAGFLTSYTAAQGPEFDPVRAELQADAAYRENPPVYVDTVVPQGRPAETPDDVLYFWDFEGDDGGFTSTLDWEWGTYSWVGGGGCSASAAPPASAYSGTDMWGTVLNTCYNGLGNNDGYDTCVNGNPADDSVLSFDVDLSNVSSTAELVWWEWFDLFLDWDWGEVYVNDDVVFQHCGGGYIPPTAWVSQTVDLSSYLGGVVTIKFHMMASSVVNYAGWWIDDVMITGDLAVQEPDIVVDAPPLQTELCPDSTDVITFTICNVGAGDLIWNFDEMTATIGYDVPWLSEDPVSGTLAPDLCIDVDVTFDSTGMMPGDYFAHLLIESNDPDEPIITLPVTMTVFEPAAIIAVDVVTDGCAVTLTASLAGEPPLSWEWDLGAFGIITDVNPVFVDFGVSGSYPFTLTAWNACGMEMLTGTVDVACEEPCEPVVIEEVATDIDGCTVDFSAILSGTEPFAYLWDFGDGNTSTAPTPTHGYISGTYTVTLDVSNDCGTDTATVSVTVACEPCDPPANPSMNWSPLQPGEGVEVTFTGYAEGSEPLAFSWDFGDGNMGAGITATHAYTPSGDYTVTLVVDNDCGSALITDTITVYTETVCVPVMISDVVAAVDACTVTFTPDLSGEPPFMYLWDFGDGMTSTAALPTHLYAAPGGTFTVTLEVWNCAGSGYDSFEFAVTTSCEEPGYQIYLPLVAKNYGQ
jgi:PKD repeat protein